MSKDKIPLSAYENPAMLGFPTDKFGLTKDLKKAVIAIATRLCGDPEKLETYKETLDLLNKHVLARYTKAKAERDALKEQ